MKSPRLAGIALLSAAVLFAQAGPAPLTLEDVLESVKKHYPPLLAALLETDIADAEVLAALGKFDLSLSARADSDRFGFYSNERIHTGFDQATQWWGASFYGGWRVGDGSFAPYDGKLDTRSLGEWRGGLKLPLLQDRAIDSKRADLRKAEIGRRLARLSIDEQKLLIVQLATRRYWDWVASGRKLAVQQAVLKIAETRDEILRESVRLGNIPAIEVTDNQRAILQRRSQLVEATRSLEQSAISLSLFLRDDRGQPTLPLPEQLPAGFPVAGTVDEARLRSDLESAMRIRPEIGAVEAERDRAAIDRRYYTNQRMPRIDLGLGFTAESGAAGSVKRGPSELKASLSFELPFQRRAATGKLQATEAKIRQLDRKLQFTRDKVVADVRDAASAVRAARQRADLLRQEVDVARQLEEAERARFQLGDSTLFLVNLREQATVDAANREISAWNDYFRALAQYEYAVAAALR